MNLALIAVGLGIFFFLAVFFLLYAVSMRRLGVRKRVVGVEDEPQVSLGQRLQELADRLVSPMGRMLVRSPEEVSRQRQELIVAGYRRKGAVFLYYGGKVAAVGLLLLAFSLAGTLVQRPLVAIILAVGAGFSLPSLWLGWKIRQRKLTLQLALPDMMDLAVVCVEAGLGLDQSLVRIGRELRTTHPELSEELRAYELETNAGVSRVAALRNLAARTELDDLKALTAVLIQADRFGTSIGQSLRVFSDSLRVKRRQLAEERAAKLNVKMVFPLVVFIFPAIVVVVVGPAIVRIVNQLLPFLKGGGH